MIHRLHGRREDAAARRALAPALTALLLLTALAASACERRQPQSATSAPAPASSTSPAAARIAGINLEGIQHEPHQWPFLNVLKVAPPFMARNARHVEGGRNAGDSGLADRIPRDDDGYPLGLPADVPGAEAAQVVWTRIYAGVRGRYPAGEYTVLFDGSGDLLFGGDAREATHASAPGRRRILVTPTDEGISIVISRSQPGDHLRNLRILAPPASDTGTAQGGNPFHPLFLERLRPFKVIRFMDWQRTNSTPARSWSDLKPPSYYTFNLDTGVPPAVMIDLCNALGASPWLCIPHAADDDLVRALAALVRDRLDPALRVYVEYSNEVWNDQFVQGRYAAERGVARGLSADPAQARALYTALRSGEIFHIFEYTFGGAARLVRVVPSQATNTGLTRRLLSYGQQTFGRAWADALAIAPYFSIDGRIDPARLAALDLDGLFDLLPAAADAALAHAAAHKAMADAFGLALVAYEGGQHLVGEGDDRLTLLYITANRDRRMYRLLRMYHDGWWERGGGLMCAFTLTSPYSKWGSWGYLEWQDQRLDEAHKYRALVDSISAAQRAQPPPLPPP
jgi:hypothetical protein